MIVLLEQSAFHLRCGGSVEEATGSGVHSENMSDHVGIFDDLFHQVCSVESFGGFDFIKEEFGKSFGFIVVPPDVGCNFPKHVNVNIQVFDVFLNLIDDFIDFARVKVIVADHDQDEIFKDPNFVLFFEVAQRVEEFFFVVETTFQGFETPFKTDFVLNIVNRDCNLVVKFLFESFERLNCFFEV